MGGLIFGGGLYSGGGAYIWNEVSVSTCGGLIHGGAYIRRFTVVPITVSTLSVVGFFTSHLLW